MRGQNPSARGHGYPVWGCKGGVGRVSSTRTRPYAVGFKSHNSPFSPTTDLLHFHNTFCYTTSKGWR
jgi:hypothetical protein